MDINITQTQRDNLVKLAGYLEALPADYEHFHMEEYAVGASDEYIEVSEVSLAVIHTCGAAACAIGHGPLAGIPTLPGEDWDMYEDRAFGISQDHTCATWDHLFGPDNSNDPKAAATRIRKFLAS